MWTKNKRVTCNIHDHRQFFMEALFSSFTDRVAEVGNEIIGSNSGIDVAGATFLVNDVVMEPGIVFAFSAYFRHDSRIKFQMWRPVNFPNTTEFTLLGEIPVTPSVTQMREDVSTPEVIFINQVKFM